MNILGLASAATIGYLYNQHLQYTSCVNYFRHNVDKTQHLNAKLRNRNYSVTDPYTNRISMDELKGYYITKGPILQAYAEYLNVLNHAANGFDRPIKPSDLTEDTNRYSYHIHGTKTKLDDKYTLIIDDEEKTISFEQVLRPYRAPEQDD
jgi:hypothetical protein